jgi:DNA gyrase/topoisomerase IV subunit B
LKKHIAVGSEYCQYGLVVLNAVCAEFQVETIWKGEYGKRMYKKGNADNDWSIVPSTATDRTIFRFTLDRELLGERKIHLDLIQARVKKINRSLGLKLNITFA